MVVLNNIILYNLRYYHSLSNLTINNYPTTNFIYSLLAELIANS